MYFWSFLLEVFSDVFSFLGSWRMIAWFLFVLLFNTPMLAGIHAKRFILCFNSFCLSRCSFSENVWLVVSTKMQKSESKRFFWYFLCHLYHPAHLQGKLWSTLLDKDCGQSVCTKKGNKGVWEQCPRPATQDKLEEMERTMLSALAKLEEKIEEQCGYQTTFGLETTTPVKGE